MLQDLALLSSVSRRSVLRTLATLSLASFSGYTFRDLFAQTTTSSTSDLDCVLSPTMTEGPYWVDEKLNRSDLTTDTTRSSVLNGLPLLLTINVFKATANSCAVAQGVQIDVWHADAIGEYSDASGNGQSSTKGQTFLRGYQTTDSSGIVTFKTIYPGWYGGRTAHIHVRARVFDASGNATYNFTTQLFFDDSVTDSVYSNAPYNSRGTRDTRNTNDMHYNGVSNKTDTLLTLNKEAAGGYSASIAMGLQNLPDSVATSSTRNFSVSTTSSGSSSNLTLTSIVSVASADIGTQGSVFLAAQVANTWYVHNGSQWVVYNIDFPAYYTGTLQATHTVSIFSGQDVQAFCGADIYVGYGNSLQAMLDKSQYQKVYTLCQ